MKKIYIHLEDCILSTQGKDLMNKIKDKENYEKLSMLELFNDYKDLNFNTSGN